MANNSEKYIQGVTLQSGGVGGSIFPTTNTPTQYGNRQRQYLARRTEQFIKERAKYSSDYVQANVQGLFTDDFYRYVSTSIRLADIAAQSASGSKNVDDVKVILFAEPSIDYFPIGAKIRTMGSTWICTNPSNISSVHSTAVVQRCNAAYCLYDYYGNIVTEPIIVEKVTMASTANSTPENLVMMEGYFNVTCQLNEHTRHLGQNQRLILGSKAYHITGFTDFIQEFTGDYDSVHILRFSIRIEEPNESDDLINHIENGKNYTFAAELSGADNIKVGETAQLTAHFIKNGKEAEGTENNPLTWEWQSSAPDVAEVGGDGTVTAKAAGNAVITAVLSQNKAITASLDIIVEATQTTPYVAFIGVVPTEIEQYSMATLTAGYYEGGELTENLVTWTFEGAGTSYYSGTVEGNSVTILCLGQCDTPLKVTAIYNGISVSTEIILEGY